MFPVARYDSVEVVPARGPGYSIGALMQPNLSLAAGTAVAMVTSASASEVQSLSTTGTPTTASFQLVFNGQVTSTVLSNPTAAQVQAALQALPNIGAGNVVCTGGPLPGSAITITFTGQLANLPQPIITITNATFVGGTSPTVGVTRTTLGVAQGRWGAYNSGASNGLQTCRGILRYPVSTDEQGKIVLSSSTKTPEYSKDNEAVVWIAGQFPASRLTGLDATALSQLFGRVIEGTSVNDSQATVLIPGA